MSAKRGMLTNFAALIDPDFPMNQLAINADGSINVVIVSGSVTVTPVKAATATDKSFTTTGADVTVIAANAARLGYLIENPQAAALNANGDSIFVRLGAAGAADGTSYEVTPGGYFPMPGMPLYTGAVHVFGAAGVKCPASELTA